MPAQFRCELRVTLRKEYGKPPRSADSPQHQSRSYDLQSDKIILNQSTLVISISKPSRSLRPEWAFTRVRRSQELTRSVGNDYRGLDQSPNVGKARLPMGVDIRRSSAGSMPRKKPPREEASIGLFLRPHPGVVSTGAAVGSSATREQAVAPETSFAPRPPAKPMAKSVLVSKQMSRMPRVSTKPELLVRRALHARGLRFRLHRKNLPGTPDIVLTKARIAVFVDGCFWHSCPAHGVLPKNNREWWAAKLATNIDRDRRKDAELVELGWVPVHLWEHVDPEDAATQIWRLWDDRTRHSTG